VCVERLPSEYEVDDKIRGMAWVDDVALVPAAPVAATAEPPKP
jgi:hypothetical protein